MSRYRIEYTTTGRAWIDVEADSLDAAKAMAKTQDHDDIPDGQVEWEYDGIQSVTEVPGG